MKKSCRKCRYYTYTKGGHPACAEYSDDFYGIFIPSGEFYGECYRYERRIKLNAICTIGHSGCEIYLTPTLHIFTDAEGVSIGVNFLCFAFCLIVYKKKKTL